MVLHLEDFIATIAFAMRALYAIILRACIVLIVFVSDRSEFLYLHLVSFNLIHGIASRNCNDVNLYE